jgi:DNA-directed RNA polymerase specialized sigma24 family protein
MSKETKEYLNNKYFFQLLVAYKQAREKNENAKMPDELGRCIMLLCERLASRLNFNGYTYKEDLIGDAIENCILSIKTFDPEKSDNAFAYFTQIAWNAFIRRIKKENKQLYIKHKNLLHTISAMNPEIFGEDDINIIPYKLKESNYAIIENFESKLKKAEKQKI